MVNITEHTGNEKLQRGLLTRKTIPFIFLSDYEREFAALAYYKITSGDIGWLIEEKWDIVNFSLSKSEKFLVLHDKRRRQHQDKT